MVTLKSIHTHPPLREKLANQLNLPIHTPQALLARDPVQLCTSLSSLSSASKHGITNNSSADDDDKNETDGNSPSNVESKDQSRPFPLHLCLNLRAAVADAAILAKYGKHPSRVTAAVSDEIEKVMIRHLEDEHGNNVAEDTSKKLPLPLFHHLRPPPLTIGMTTALDMCIHMSMSHSLSTTITAISTGSHNLDKLLHSAYSVLVRIPHAAVIPRDVSLPCCNSSDDNSKSTEVIETTKKRRIDLKVDLNQHFRNQPSLEGGVEFGKIIEFTGESAVGKSQIALTTACKAAFQNISVHYILSRNGATKPSTVRRFLRISHNIASKSNMSDTLAKDKMNNITIETAEDGFDLLKIMSKVEEMSLRERHVPRLVVIDSISGSLFANALNSTSYDGGSGPFLVKEVGLVLRRLARENNFAILVTNGVVSQSFRNNSSIIRPALSGLWRYSDIKVLLQIQADSKIPIVPMDKRKVSMRVGRASLLKHHAKSIKISDNNVHAYFGISEAGVTDISP